MRKLPRGLFQDSVLSLIQCPLLDNITGLSLFLNRCSSRYIVYDVAQVNLKYLLKVKFNYQTSLW